MTSINKCVLSDIVQTLLQDLRKNRIVLKNVKTVNFFVEYVIDIFISTYWWLSWPLQVLKDKIYFSNMNKTIRHRWWLENDRCLKNCTLLACVKSLSPQRHISCGWNAAMMYDSVILFLGYPARIGGRGRDGGFPVVSEYRIIPSDTITPPRTTLRPQANLRLCWINVFIRELEKTYSEDNRYVFSRHGGKEELSKNETMSACTVGKYLFFYCFISNFRNVLSKNSIIWLHIYTVHSMKQWFPYERKDVI